MSAITREDCTTEGPVEPCCCILLTSLSTTASVVPSAVTTVLGTERNGLPVGCLAVGTVLVGSSLYRSQTPRLGTTVVKG
jgi:hypothetical protein